MEHNIMKHYSIDDRHGHKDKLSNSTGCLDSIRIT